MDSEPDDDSRKSHAGKPLCLDQFLKLCNAADSGGRAKWLIQNGEVQVNGVVESRRRRKLVAGDVIIVNSRTYSPDAFIR